MPLLIEMDWPQSLEAATQLQRSWVSQMSPADIMTSAPEKLTRIRDFDAEREVAIRGKACQRQEGHPAIRLRQGFRHLSPLPRSIRWALEAAPSSGLRGAVADVA